MLGYTNHIECGWLPLPSQARQVKHTQSEVHQEQPQLVNSKCLHENVSGLYIGVDMLEIDVSCYNPRSDVVIVHFNVIRLGLKHDISCKLDAIVFAQ